MRHFGTQTIHTGRLILRQFIMADIRPAFAVIYSNERVFEHLDMAALKDTDAMRNKLVDMTEGYKNPEQYHWVVTLADTGEIIGTISVYENDAKQWEVGYCYGVEHWGDGHATAALFAVCEFMFERVELDALYCNHSASNLASARVIEKVGFKYTHDSVIEKFDNTKMPVKNYVLKKEDF